jgi:CheY-like chemotaxis protein
VNVLGVEEVTVTNWLEVVGTAVALWTVEAEQGMVTTAKPSKVLNDRARASHRAVRVLVVEDQMSIADALGALLELWGYEVSVTYDGEAALAAATTFHPRVVLLDLGLPGIDGYEVALKLRECPELENVLIVATTGHGSADDRRRSRAAGFDHHLLKPVEPAVLRQLLRAV